MSLLSITERELRVASRKRSTYALRVFSSGIALLVAGFSLWAIMLFGGNRIAGTYLFWFLSWIAFGCACLFGCGLTSDAISEEKREGTLGLLFLTPLKGHAVILGKFLAHGLLAFYGILAILPVIALPMLIGGASAMSLLGVGVAIVLTLSLSLTLGLLFSTLCRRGWIASALSVLILALLTIVIPVIAPSLSRLGTPFPSVPLLFSPSYVLSISSWGVGGLPSNGFNLALTTQGLVVLLLLGIASLIVPHCWKERQGRKSLFWRHLKYGGQKIRPVQRARMLMVNPIFWLCARERFPGLGFLCLIVLADIAVTFLGQRFAGPKAFDQFSLPVLIWVWVLPALYVMFCFRLAAAASERFATDRLNGALELVLSTPNSIKTILRGQWLALFRQLWGSALVLLVLHGFILYYIMQALQTDVGGEINLYEAFRGTFAHLRGTEHIDQRGPFYIIPLALFSASLLIVVLWIALGWTSMFMGMRISKPVAAPWIALIALAVPPLPIFIAFAACIVWRQWFSTDIFLRLLTLGFAGFLFVLTNAMFWLFLSRHWLYRNFRSAATDRYQEKKPRWFRIV